MPLFDSKVLRSLSRSMCGETLQLASALPYASPFAMLFLAWGRGANHIRARGAGRHP
eukprot:CAMPEP_0119380966 /NCGR_PEP_ID=MMETSP1334-20130426/59306_1 /TAXON_ID=127549 /ORGANISM="Calcidiscus leptoporus, Strain RCC1130" /LENGTH=56 /DNA_ID=CAMNT_0007400949 /DNA_START=11 /DNA_END=181 /DNA_ORIENTATION=-